MVEFFLAVLLLLGRVEDAEARRFAEVAEQGFDDSCGLRALASLLEKYRGIPADEAGLALLLPVARAGNGSREDLRVSLLDLQGLARAVGLEAVALRLSLRDLDLAESMAPPLLLHMAQPRGHYVLLIGSFAFRGRRVFVVADPAEGLLGLDEADLGRRWSGAVLALGPGPGAPPGADLARVLRTVEERYRLLGFGPCGSTGRLP